MVVVLNKFEILESSKPTEQVVWSHPLYLQEKVHNRQWINFIKSPYFEYLVQMSKTFLSSLKLHVNLQRRWDAWQNLLLDHTSSEFASCASTSFTFLYDMKTFKSLLPIEWQESYRSISTADCLRSFPPTCIWYELVQPKYTYLLACFCFGRTNLEIEVCWSYDNMSQFQRTGNIQESMVEILLRMKDHHPSMIRKFEIWRGFSRQESQKDDSETVSTNAPNWETHGYLVNY